MIVLRFNCLLLGVLAFTGCNRGPTPAGSGPVTPPIIIAPSSKKETTKQEHVLLTENAANEVKRLIDEHGGGYLRVSVDERGAYKLDLDKATDPQKDTLTEQRGIKIVVDSQSAMSLPTGITIDFVNQDGEKGFRFITPKTNLQAADVTKTLAEARRGHQTKAMPSPFGKSPIAEPPAKMMQVVRYDTSLGAMSAYLTPDPKDGNKHPAIIWITGGDCNSIDAGCWREGPAANDQSASAYRKVGLVMMFPSLRGGNDNPGTREGFYGEVDDVLAAEAYLRKQPYVDPQRIYLGGHSTGGTLVLLTAACTDRFRAIFSFGPVDDVLGYDKQYTPFDVTNRQERWLRAPIRWLHSIRTPVFVIEGTGGNHDSLDEMQRVCTNPKISFVAVPKANHFNVLGPTNRLLAEKILRDTGAINNITLTAAEVNQSTTK